MFAACVCIRRAFRHLTTAFESLATRALRRIFAFNWDASGGSTWAGSGENGVALTARFGAVLDAKFDVPTVKALAAGSLASLNLATLSRLILELPRFLTPDATLRAVNRPRRGDEDKALALAKAAIRDAASYHDQLPRRKRYRRGYAPPAISAEDAEYEWKQAALKLGALGVSPSAVEKARSPGACAVPGVRVLQAVHVCRPASVSTLSGLGSSCLVTGCVAPCTHAVCLLLHSPAVSLSVSLSLSRFCLSLSRCLSHAVSLSPDFKLPTLPPRAHNNAPQGKQPTPRPASTGAAVRASLEPQFPPLLTITKVRLSIVVARDALLSLGATCPTSS